jgi:hypothetical protein
VIEITPQANFMKQSKKQAKATMVAGLNSQAQI